MGIASLVLGIVSLILAFVPCCGIISVVPAVIGLILGIIEVVKKKKSGEPKGKGIAGIVLGVVAIIVTIVWFLIFGVAAMDSYNESMDYYSSSYYY